MKSYLTTMTIDEFVKHMEAELKVLNASPDDERQAALEESVKAFDALDKTQEGARVPVRMVKADEPTDEFSKKLDSALEALAAMTAKVDELAGRLDKAEKAAVADEAEAKEAEPKVEEPKAEGEPKVETAEKSDEPEVEEPKAEDKPAEDDEDLEKVSWESDLAPNLSADDAHKLGSVYLDNSK